MKCMPSMLRLTEVRVCGPSQLELSFNDGTNGIADLHDLLDGPVLEVLRDEELFSQAILDPLCVTAVWPNGADLAPQAWHACLQPVAV